MTTEVKDKTTTRARPAAPPKITRVSRRADRVIDFVSRLTVPSGVGQGGNFEVHPFEEKFIRDVYEPHNLAGKRAVRRAILSIARKNGKTALMAILALAHLIGPEVIPNGEIFTVANEREQAAQIFKVVCQIIRAEPELARRLKIVDSTKTVVHYGSGSVFRSLSAEAGTKHGLNPSLVIYDELAQAKSRDLYDVMDSSMGARVEPLFIIISTQSNDPQHVLSELIDDALNAEDSTSICHLYAVPDDVEDIFDESVWQQANPALGTFRDLEDFRALARKAQRMPAEEPKFRNLYLNQRVSPTVTLVPRRIWMERAGVADFKDGEKVYLGLDLSSVNDLSALAMISHEDPTRAKVFFWKPVDTLRDHSDRDFGHGNWRYEEWHRAGWLETTPGAVIDHEVIARKLGWIMQTYTVMGCAYDRHKIEYLMRSMNRVDVAAHKEGDDPDSYTSLKLVPWGQGYVSMTPAIDAFEKMVSNGSLIHGNSPLLNWNVANAIGVMDPAGNRKLDKEKSRFRIDGAVALVMACGLKSRDLDEDSGVAGFLKGAVMT